MKCWSVSKSALDSQLNKLSSLLASHDYDHWQEVFYDYPYLLDEMDHIVYILNSHLNYGKR